ncbi:isopenicillin N synthase family dioxygenase [Hyphobacterium sp.]|uniref:isopenicillin N synthase family dioxygenase n=1 Tax=Hyphobacterium sp. TaxID=2004662 RepID=UPI003748A5D5
MTESVMTINYVRLEHGNQLDYQVFRSELISGLREQGFVRLVNHGIDPAFLRRCYHLSEAFFAQDESEKRKYAGALRGYTPFGTEHAKDHAAPDLKEFWQIGHEAEDGHPVARPNVWPDTPADFRETFQTLFQDLFTLGQRLLGVIADDLKLEHDYFDQRIEGGTSLLRLLHYPPIPDGVDPDCIRAAAHEDINLITLLVAAEGAGLEILDADGNWLPVENGPNEIIVDTGDMMKRLTNGYFPATTHRVVNPSGPNVSRYSMPFFVQPRPDVSLACLPGCRHLKTPEPDITVGEFLNQRLKDIGLPGV